MHRDVEVDGGQIGESMCRHLVRRQIAIAQVLDLQILVVFGFSVIVVSLAAATYAFVH